ncbi:MAG: hypothetical protein JXR94_20830 [Candidatus Hydrogenedentes bacterium]|nr:hypothetical protein [Candidatus Hydrogenedentota bacterium]
MRRLVLTLVVLAAVGWDAAGQIETAESRIVWAGMFKNGLAAVKRVVEVEGPGTWRLEEVPEPVHGTFWIESDARVEARVEMEEVEEAYTAGAGIDLQQDLAGREVVLHFRDPELKPVSGVVLAVPEGEPDSLWRPADVRGRQWQPYTPAPQASFLILDTADGRMYVERSMVVCAQVKDARDVVVRKKPVLYLTIDAAPNARATVEIGYLTGGLAWAPGYRVDLSDPKRLTIQQQAVIRNELEDIREAGLELISGFPSVEFAHVTSPLSLRTSWTQFFQQLNQRPQMPHAVASNVITQQAFMPQSEPAGGLDLSAIPFGEGPDIYYHDIGKRTIGRNATLLLDIGSQSAAYERIVEWIVPDTRREDGRPLREHELNQDPDKYRDAAWDAVRFKNPFDFPMTTAPAFVVGDDRFYGQRTSFWANRGETTTLHITKALSIRTRSVEEELAGTREIVYIAGDSYQKTQVKGALTLSNHRNERVTVVIRRRFSGELLEADGEPEASLREEGAWCVNKRNELVWMVTLDPGEAQTLTYEYAVLVNT